ncbi:hypothetical protein J2P12_08385 [Candidatus Bathyarchaeota archaeon]|nr:hypothetical protein [Candidatus Bathyarchaeota archaeon]
MGSNVVIKDVDGAAYRSLKAEAVRAGLKVGQAASQAFRLLVHERSLRGAKDFDTIRKASREIDRLREKVGRVPGYDSTRAIRECRDRRKS